MLFRSPVLKKEDRVQSGKGMRFLYRNNIVEIFQLDSFVYLFIE